MLFRQAGGQQFIPSGREKTILDAPLVKNASADSSLAAASQFFPAGKDKITRYGAGKQARPPSGASPSSITHSTSQSLRTRASAP